MSGYQVVLVTNTALRRYSAGYLQEALRLRRALLMIWASDQPRIEIVRAAECGGDPRPKPSMTTNPKTSKTESEGGRGDEAPTA